MMGLYDFVDVAIAGELGVKVEEYVDVIENKCSHWESVFILGSIWEEGRDDRKEKAKALFIECQSR